MVLHSSHVTGTLQTRQVRLAYIGKGLGYFQKLPFNIVRHTNKPLPCFSHSLSRHPSIEWDDTGDLERDWSHGGSGNLSRAHSYTSIQVGWT